MILRSALLSVALAISLLATSPTPAQAYEVGCVVYPQAPRMADYDMLMGVAEQTCVPGRYLQQRIRIRIQRKEVIPFWPDEWHTKRLTYYSGWNIATAISRVGAVLCSTRQQGWWRTWVDGQFINRYGETAYGSDFSDERYLPCAARDQLEPV